MTDYPGGHRLRPFTDDAGVFPSGAMYCRNCLLIDPDPGSECTDDF